MPSTGTFDVVIVGAGAGGLAAAIEAGRAGARVLLLEKARSVGGMMNWAVGTVSAVNTRQQKALGVSDSVESHFHDLGVHAGDLAPRDNLALRRILVDATPDLMDWLLDLGIVFAPPMVDPPQSKPRMHNVVPSAASFAWHLLRACRRAGVEVRTGAGVRRLVEAGGRVMGVEVDGQRILARRGVILATGDYSGSADLKRAFGAGDVADVEPVADTSTGDGYTMAMALGAAIRNGDLVRGPILRFVPPRQASLLNRLPPVQPLARAIAWAMGVAPAFLLRPFLMKFLTTVLGPSPALFREGAVLVNRDGCRFTDERGSPAADVARQPGRDAWIVLDAALARKFQAWPHFVSTAPGIAYAYVDDYRRCRADLFHAGAGVADLARSLGMAAENLAASIRGQGPFIALGPVRSYVVFTEGGLGVSEHGEVLREDGSVIAGLFAVGSVGQGGLLLEGHGHHLDWAFISGRRVGRYLARAGP